MFPPGWMNSSSAYTDFSLSYDDFVSSTYVRLRRIRELLHAGLIDDMLRLQPSALLPQSAS